VGGTQQKIAELKTVHCSNKSKYYSKTKIPISGAPVGARARAIPAEYKKNAKDADILYNNKDVNDTTPGPIETRLESLGKVLELVVGHFSEGSSDLHELVKQAAKAAGEKHWKRIGAYNSREARGTFMTRFVRKIGITAAVQLSILRRKAFNRMMGADLRAQAEAGEEAGEEDNNGNRYYSAQQEYQS
ncbi:hypothetical protein ScalyP_jg420, partial [Parmales sp. scaly parma]